MEYIIQLQRTKRGTWDVHVRLPIKWLQRFKADGEEMFMGEKLNTAWGAEYYENDEAQPWRYRVVSFLSETLARQNITYLQQGLRVAILSLVEPLTETYRGSLDPEAQERPMVRDDRGLNWLTGGLLPREDA